MKIVQKSIIIICITILCIICTQVISFAQTAKITTETLRLRKSPTTDSSILELISEGEKVEVLESGLGDDGNWYKVKYKTSEGNITGYVYGEFIKIENNNTQNTNQNKTNANNNTNTNTSTNTTNNSINETTNSTNAVENTIINNNIENNTVENNIVENNISDNTQTENKPEENTEPANSNIDKIEINTDRTVYEETELYIVPLINADKIHTVEKEQKLHIIQVLNGWAYVSFENNYGWLRCSELN